jgi:hypothetical protein
MTIFQNNRKQLPYTWSGCTRCNGFCLGMLTRRMGRVLALNRLLAPRGITFFGTGGGSVDTYDIGGGGRGGRGSSSSTSSAGGGKLRRLPPLAEEAAAILESIRGGLGRGGVFRLTNSCGRGGGRGGVSERLRVVPWPPTDDCRCRSGLQLLLADRGGTVPGLWLAAPVLLLPRNIL